jgi:exodeoxyribonuclease V beta subunit
VNRFELLTDPLTPGVAVIEASAGTGKTFALAGLVLRLLLEPDGAAPPPGIDQLLVVTYTNAATDELRERIRARLRSATDAFERGATDDALEQSLLTRFAGADERAQAGQRLQDALTLFDQAAIFTIHGFCQRVLRDRAFETDSLFDAELAADNSDRLREVAFGFIRQQLAGAEPGLVASGLAQLLTPELLLATARAVQPHTEFTVSPEPGESTADRLVAARTALLEFWRTHRAEVGALFGGGRANPTFKADFNKDSFAAEVEALRERLERGESWTADTAKLLDALSLADAHAAVLAKPKQAPNFAFFEAVQAVLDARQSLGRELQARFALELHARLAAAQQRAKTQSFDELLRRTDAALAGGSGPELAATLRRTYRAALIDEFQDTDPLQWRIFARLFADSGAGHRLRLIGDPKQAIYGFRGADVATYLTARESVSPDARTTLGTNWRSEAKLVAAVNQLFGNHPQPFANPRIEFAPVAAASQAEAHALRDPSATAPLQLWLLGQGYDDKTIAKEPAGELARAAIVAEIERLLGDPNVTLGGARVRPRDIAVLVPLNREALELQDALRRRGIPSVLQAAESVFASDEVATVESLLDALESPHSPSLLRRLLATPARGFTLADFARLDTDADFAADVAEAFARHVQNWQRRGFAAAFRGWLEGEGVRARLMARPDGERRLTNLLHLGELLHAAEQAGHTGTALSRWLADQKSADAQAVDDTEMRLESDASAVRLVTIHKSKGLEYPIVFCAFLWRGVEPSKNRERDPLVVRRAVGGPLIDLAGYRDSTHREAYAADMLQEHLRLLYVALTRARNRCYLLTGPISGLETSALGWLLHARSPAGEIPDLAALSARLQELPLPAMRAELQTIADQSGGTIALADTLPALGEHGGGWAEAPLPLAGPREFHRSGFDRWAIQSYSGLIAGAAEEAPDHDAVELAAEPAEAEELDEFARLPRGTTLGTCVHEVFELMDFTGSRETWTPLVETSLRRHQLPVELWRDTTLRLLERVMTAPLNADGNTFRLCDVPPGRRINELEFFLPLRGFNVPALQQAFARHAVDVPVADWPTRVADLGFEAGDGFLHGYVDAIVEHAGRYYLLDWKTNWLGPAAAAYTAATVNRAMRGGFYVLQYHLYAVALRRYLRLRRPEADFATAWGGVFYAFLRGIDPAQPGQGWFFHRPSDALLDELEHALESGGAA